jgi:MarR family transcriptional regulator, 2-MHQ and catechol-resistance regulon repressor
MPTAPAPISRTQPASLDADASAFHDALSELVRVYQFRDRDRICCHDVSVTQCYAIDALLRRGPSSLNELAAELYLDKSTASRVVATLARKGYVTRTPHPDDGRAIVLGVTAAGRRLHDRIRKDMVGEAAELLKDFEPEVRKGAARLLLRVARAAAARSGLSGPSCCITPSEE